MTKLIVLLTFIILGGLVFIGMQDEAITQETVTKVLKISD